MNQIPPMVSRREFSKLMGLGSVVGASVLAGASSVQAQALPPPSETINVMAFGAKGDGITNDQPAIQAALDSVGVAGGHVVFPPGVYRIDFPVFIRSRVNSTAGFVVSGSGQNCLLKASAGFPVNVSMMYVLGGNAVIEDIGLAGDSRAQNGIEYAYSAPDSPKDRVLTVSRVSLSGMLSNGINCVGGDSYQIRDCFFNTLGGYAIYNYDGGLNSFVEGNYMLGCGGVYLGKISRQPEGVRIINNTILSSTGVGIGVRVDWGLEIQIANNVIDQVKTAAVMISNNSSCVKCTDNWFGVNKGSTTVSALCLVQHDANAITFSNNTFEGAYFQLSFVATSPGRIRDLIVSNNIFNNALDTALYFSNVSRASISGNHVPVSAKESLFWAAGQYGVAFGNVFWKAPGVVGAGLLQNSNIGW